MNQLYKILVLACKSLKISSLSFFTIAASLCIAIGALVAVVQLNYTLLLKPLPFLLNEQLVVVNHKLSSGKQVTDGQGANIPASVLTYQFSEKQDFKFIQATAITKQGKELVNIDKKQLTATVSFATSKYFSFFDTQFIGIDKLDSSRWQSLTSPVALLSHSFWQNQLNADPNVIGMSLKVAGIQVSVLGVLTPDFYEPELYPKQTQIWLPWRLNTYNDNERNNWFLTKSEIKSIALLQPTANIEAAEQELSEFLDYHYQAKLYNTDLHGRDTHFSASVTSLNSQVIGDSPMTAIALLLSVLGILIITCSNIINILVIRAANRQQQFAIYQALGARPSYLFYTFLAESALLMLICVIGSLVVEGWILEFIKATAVPYFPRLTELNINAISIALVVGSCTFLTFLFTYHSYKTINTGLPNSRLFSNKQNTNMQLPKRKFQFVIMMQTLTATLVFSFSLTIITSAYFSTFQSFAFNTSGLYSLTLSSQPTQSTKLNNKNINRSLERLLQKHPDVVGVAKAYVSPLTNNMSMLFKSDKNTPLGAFPVNFVTANYFKLIELPILYGRSFTQEEVTSDAKVLIISNSLATKINPRKTVVGSTIKLSDNVDYEIIGVSDDLTLGAGPSAFRKIGEQIYLPYDDWNTRLILRVSSEQPEATVQTLINLVSEKFKNQGAVSLSSINDIYDFSIAKDKYYALLAIIIGFLSLLLASLGMYGVTNYRMTSRKHEFAIRYALGTRPKALIYSALSELYLPLIIGFVCAILVLIGALWSPSLQDSHLITETLKLMVVTIPTIVIIYLIAVAPPVLKLLRRSPMNALGNE